MMITISVPIAEQRGGNCKMTVLQRFDTDEARHLELAYNGYAIEIHDGKNKQTHMIRPETLNELLAESDKALTQNW